MWVFSPDWGELTVGTSSRRHPEAIRDHFAALGIFRCIPVIGFLLLTVHDALLRLLE